MAPAKTEAKKIERPDDLIWVRAMHDGSYGLSPNTCRFIEEGEYFQVRRSDLSDVDRDEVMVDKKGNEYPRPAGWMKIVTSRALIEKALEKKKVNFEPDDIGRGPQTRRKLAEKDVSGEKEHEPEEPIVIEDEDGEPVETGPEADLGPEAPSKEDREPPGRPAPGATVERKPEKGGKKGRGRKSKDEDAD